MKYQIKRVSWSYLPPLDVEIRDDVPESERMLVAVVAAVQSGANLREADLGGANLGGANLREADLGGANLGGAYLPSPTVLLLASWGAVSDELCADLMLFDAACHPDPAAFDRWAQGGACPYSDVKVERAANFTERRDLWGKGEVCRPYDLAMRLLAEKCPEWSDEERAAFEARFKKETP